MLDFELRRLKFVEACAYYIRIAAISVDQLEMTQDLADLITERFRAAKLEWAIGPVKFYERLLDEGMKEKCIFFPWSILCTCHWNSIANIFFSNFTVPDFDGKILNKSVVLHYNFRSMVTWEVREKELLLASTQKSISNKKDTNGNEVWHSPLQPHPAKQQSSMPSAAPHDFLIGNFINFLSPCSPIKSFRCWRIKLWILLHVCV